MKILRAQLENRSRRREEADRGRELAENPPPYVGGYGVVGFFKHALNGVVRVGLLGGWATSSQCFGADQVLLNFSGDIEPSKLVQTDARATQVKSGEAHVLRIATGHAQTWPGITLLAPKGHWDLSQSAQVTLPVNNLGTNSVTVYCRVDNPGANGMDHCVTASITLFPGGKNVLRIPLKRTHDDTLQGNLFGMRGYPVSTEGPGTIDPANVTQLVIFVSQPKSDHLFELGPIQANGSYAPPTAWVSDANPFFPFIDTFGQYRHKTWPGKTTSAAGLVAQRNEEARELAAQPGPVNWDKYGGSAKGPKLRASGFFRTEKVRGKWWLVDPEGHLFFSHGIDCVRALDVTPIEQRETWFEDFPGNQPEFAELFSTAYALKGHYAGSSPKCFSFAGANYFRKYGASWKQDYPAIIHKRLRSWGLNTIANWSDENTFLMRRTPYTDAVASSRTKMVEGSEGYWGKFPDVFDPSFTNSLRHAMEGKRNKSANDPWCIGYFSDNEMSWGDEVSLALGTLKSPPEQAAKEEFIAKLRTRYSEIDRLNQVWGTSYSSWDSFRESREVPDKKRAGDDLVSFYSEFAEQYFRSVRDTIKSVAPNQLYLGCRFAWVNARAAAAAAKYCDVVSYNLYQVSVADFKFNGGADVPLIIGEFHFGALDRGLFHTGLVPMPNQAARAEAYRNYVRGALHHPQFVGCHWFQYKDEPTTGRAYDEENYQIGFVDVADTPYRETIEASREVGYHLYE